MDTQTFLETVLPSQGHRCVTALLAKGGSETFKADNDEAARVIAKCDRNGLPTYFACASYSGTQTRRSAADVVAVKAFWVDVDCGAGKPYPNQAAGLLAMKAALRAMALPMPMIVDSGNGLHLYWPLTSDIDRETWQGTARLLKAAVRAAGLHADPTRTADVASILRPPGTFNRKDPAAPLEVRVLRAILPVEHEDLHNTLTAYLDQINVSVDDFALPPGKSAAVGGNDDLKAGLYSGSRTSGAKIAESCGVMAELRDSHGNVPYPHWYKCLGVLAHCEDGDDLAHDWSSGYAGYDADQTQKFLDKQKNFGPTLCQTFHDNATPDICASCPHFGKIKTPMQLGRIDDVVVQVVNPTTGAVAPAVVNKKIDVGAGFFVDDEGRLLHFIEDADGNKCVEPLMNGFLRGVCLLDDCESGKGWSMRMEHLRRREPAGDVMHYFVLDCGLINGGTNTLMAELSRQGVAPLKKRDNTVIERLILDQMHKLTAMAEEAKMQDFFGWRDDAFALGSRLIVKGGDRPVQLAGPAHQKRLALTPAGDLSEWVRVIDTAYNYPGQEAYQFMVLCGFAAPLFALSDEAGVAAITVYAHSIDSGVGKTTAQQAALSIWGDYREMFLTYGQATENALFKLLGVYHNLPVVYDEMTKMAKDKAGELVYTVSQGNGKQSLDTSGELRTNRKPWRTIMMASGNNSLSEKIALQRANSEAEHVRLFEFPVAKGKSKLSPNEAAKLFPLLAHNYGHAGEVFARKVVENLPAIKKAMANEADALRTEFCMVGNERYWATLLAAVVVSQRLARHLGLIGFDLAGMRAWLHQTIGHNRELRNSAGADEGVILKRMIHELSPRYLVTTGIGDARFNPAFLERRPSGVCAGRQINPMQKGKTYDPPVPVLWLDDDAARQWCAENGVSASEIYEKCVHANLIKAGHNRESLGKGVREYSDLSARRKVWIIENLAADVSAADPQGLRLVSDWMEGVAHADAQHD